VTDRLRDLYFRYGGAAGWPGWPTGDATCDASGCRQTFTGGILSTTSSGPAFGIPAAIATAWDSLGGLEGFGAAQSDPIQILENGGGVGQVFAGGSIYASAAGAYGVAGAIRAQYFATGGAAGPLGWPSGAASCAASECSQAFTGGILVVGAQGGVIVQSAVFSAWRAGGGSAGEWGWPLSNPIPIQDGWGQVFAGGSAYASQQGAFLVTEPIRTRYFGSGGADGAYGWPAGQATCSATACTQQFTGGAITVAR